MNAKYKGYTDIIIEEGENKMNELLKQTAKEDMVKSPKWFSLLLNLLFSKRDLISIEKKENNGLIGRVISGFMPSKTDLTNKRKNKNENTILAASIRVKVFIADFLTHVIINLRSCGQTPSIMVYNLSKLIANARITRSGFELLSKYGLTTSYTSFTSALKKASLQNFYTETINDYKKTLLLTDDEEVLPVISYDNYVKILYANEMTDNKNVFVNAIHSLTCLAGVMKKHPGWLKNDDRPKPFPKFTDQEIDNAVELIGLGYMDFDEILIVNGVSVRDKTPYHLANCTPIASWPGYR